MGRLQTIEDLVAGTLPIHNNLKLMVRGRPHFVDPQLDDGVLRFAKKRGFNFTAIAPDNRDVLAENAIKPQTRITLRTRPGWMKIGSLIRIGMSSTVGELHIIQDLIDTTGIELAEPLLNTYPGISATTLPTYVTLAGVAAKFFEIAQPPEERSTLLIETSCEVYRSDEILMSRAPDVLQSLTPYRVRSATPIEGNFEPGVYRYVVEIDTQTGRLPFTPQVDQVCYIVASPAYRHANNIQIPATMGPCLLDVYGGALLISDPVTTRLGIKTFDSFGTQTSPPPWLEVPSNYMILERPIFSEQLLFWQRIRGNFQLKKTGNLFQAQLDQEGQFVMSSDILIPNWPADRQRGWVIPVRSEAAIRIAIQFDPQPPQYFDVPAQAVTFLRPRIQVGNQPIVRIMISMLGAPNSRVEIRTWQFDGTVVDALSYYILGTGLAFGEGTWLAGGVSLKPLFLSLESLKARYSDGVSHYNAGYFYM